MKKDFEMGLSIEDPIMAPMKEDMNHSIQRLLDRMISKGSDEGTLTTKIKFRIESKLIDGREIKKLSFEYKVNSAISLKEEVGNVQVNEDEELVHVDGHWVLMPITGMAQRTILDEEES